MPCRQCFIVVTPDNLRPNGESIQLHDTFSDFETAVLDGCELCGVMLYNLYKRRDQDAEDFLSFARSEEDGVKCSVFLSWQRKSIVPFLTGNPSPQHLDFGYEEYLILTLTRTSAGGIKSCSARAGTVRNAYFPATEKFVFRRSSSVDAAKFAERCIQDCDTHEIHNLCRVARTAVLSSTAHPSRLVEIILTKPNLEADPELRIVDWHSGLKSERYVTLSYRQTPAIDKIKTTKSNIGMRMQSFSYADMPQTIQDVVKICMAMEIKFLWIDVLCILQEKPDVVNIDFETENLVMGDIYANSYLTIVATGVEHLARGMFEDVMAVKHTIPARVRVFPSTGSLDVWAEQQPSLLNKYEGENEANKRLWILQEQVLSLRTLTCFSDGYVFRCQAGTHASDLDIPQIGISNSSFNNGLLHHPMAHLCPNTGVEENYWSGEYWNAMTIGINKRHLSRPDDRLVSVSGLARRIGELSGAKYIAGLFEDQLWSGLLWRSEPNSLGVTKLPAKIAPTWSWMSIRGKVQPYTAAGRGRFGPHPASIAGDRRQIRGLEVNIKPLDCRNRYGNIVPGASLRMGTVVLHGLSASPKTHIRLGRSKYTCFNSHLFNREIEFCSDGCIGIIDFDTKSDRNTTNFSIALIGVQLSDLAKVDTRLHLKPVYGRASPCTVNNDDLINGEAEVHTYFPVGYPGLAIERVQGSETYRRIGLVMVENMHVFGEAVEQTITLI